MQYIKTNIKRQPKWGEKKDSPNERTGETPGKKKLNKMERCNLSDIEFKVMVIRMLKSMKNDIGTMRKDQSEKWCDIPHK